MQARRVDYSTRRYAIEGNPTVSIAYAIFAAIGDFIP
eukprot:SAG31_NODE_1391_length_8535_cov_11.998696_5_plen_37_part_00